MPYTRDWSETVPIDHTKFKQQPGFVRDTKVDVAERLKNMFEGFIAAETNERVKKLMFRAEAGDPAAIAAVLQFYAKVAAGKTELFARNEDGTIQQITHLSGLFIEALKMAGLQAGDLLKHDGTKITRFARGTASQQLRVNAGATDLEYFTPAAGAANSPMGLFRNLKIIRPTAATVTVTADELILQDTSANTVRVSSVNVTPNITVAGANGLDTGVEAASTWYFIWVIRKSSDGTVAGLLSVSATAPTMPTGYDQKALVGGVRNDSGSNFIDFSQEGLVWSLRSWITLASGNTGSLIAWTSIDMAPFVPAAISTYCYGQWFHDDNGIYIGNDNTVAINVGTTFDYRNSYGFHGSAARLLGRWELDIITANTLYWVSNAVNNNVKIHGFILNKLV